MNKSGFINAITNPSEIGEEEVKYLEEIAKTYPFSSLPHFLLARYHYQNNTAEKEISLQIASTYATDRRVLKKFVTAPTTEIHSILPIQNENISVEENDIAEEISAENTSDEIIHEGIEEQETVSEKEDFEKDLVVESQNSNGAEIEVQLEEEEVPTTNELQIGVDDLETLKEFEESVINSELTQVKSSEETSFIGEDEIEESENEREETTSNAVESDQNKEFKNRDQIEELSRKDQDLLIDRFIKLRPSIVRASLNEPSSNQTDLSEERLSEDLEIISENLAVIMAKQGKTEKAIDIYKKLIWKYPQKKSYFANRIEELKK